MTPRACQVEIIVTSFARVLQAAPGSGIVTDARLFRCVVNLEPDHAGNSRALRSSAARSGIDTGTIASTGASSCASSA